MGIHITEDFNLEVYIRRPTMEIHIIEGFNHGVCIERRPW